MKMVKFRVCNDDGQMVDKSEELSWIKFEIARDFRCNGKSIGHFKVECTPDGLITARNAKGHTAEYRYGGFDEMEVVEPYDQGSLLFNAKPIKSKKPSPEVKRLMNEIFGNA